MTPEKAREAGGYYSESEFDLSGLDALRSQMVEVGRSCTHADQRGGSAIMLLWSGLAEFMRRGGYRYMLGCASVSLRDDGVTAAEVWRLTSRPSTVLTVWAGAGLMRTASAPSCSARRRLDR